jgi:putrescine transport system permease protein
LLRAVIHINALCLAAGVLSGVAWHRAKIVFFDIALAIPPYVPTLKTAWTMLSGLDLENYAYRGRCGLQLCSYRIAWHVPDCSSAARKALILDARYGVF